MAKYIATRVMYMIITLFVIASLTFFLMKLLPGSPYAGAAKLSPAQIELMNEQYGLNDPVPVQYAKYIFGLLKGDLGISFQFNNTPVSQLLADRIQPSFILGFQAMFMGTIIGIILGVLGALRQNTWVDYTTTFLAVIGKSIPNFVFAGLLQYYIGVKLGWLPVLFWEGFEYSIMPTIALQCFHLPLLPVSCGQR